MEPTTIPVPIVSIKNKNDLRRVLELLASDISRETACLEKDSDFQRPITRWQRMSMLILLPDVSDDSKRKAAHINSWLDRFLLGVTSVDESVGYINTFLRLPEE